MTHGWDCPGPGMAFSVPSFHPVNIGRYPCRGGKNTTCSYSGSDHWGRGRREEKAGGSAPTFQAGPASDEEGRTGGSQQGSPVNHL